MRTFFPLRHGALHGTRGMLWLEGNARDPFPVCIGSPEAIAVVVRLVLGIEVREVVQVFGRDDTDVIDKPCHGTGGVGAPGKAKAEDLVAGGIVEHDEVVGLYDVADKADAQAPLEIPLEVAEDAGADAGVVVDQLLPLLAPAVLSAAGNSASQSCDVGRDILKTRHGGLPGAVTTNHEALARGSGSPANSRIRRGGHGQSGQRRVSRRLGEVYHHRHTEEGMALYSRHFSGTHVWPPAHACPRA